MLVDPRHKSKRQMLSMVCDVLEQQRVGAAARDGSKMTRVQVAANLSLQIQLRLFAGCINELLSSG